MINSYPVPPTVTEDDQPGDAETSVKRNVEAVLRSGPLVFSDALPSTFVLKTSKHMILYAVVFDEDLDMSNLTEILDAALAPCDGEPVQSMTLCVPMSDCCLVHAWDAAGKTAYVLVEPGPFPGTFKIPVLHDHMPGNDPNGEAGDAVERLIEGSGKHLWGGAWALLPSAEDPC